MQFFEKHKIHDGTIIENIIFFQLLIFTLDNLTLFRVFGLINFIELFVPHDLEMKSLIEDVVLRHE